MAAGFRRFALILSLMCAPWLAGCEGCDFSFGAVVYTVQVTPADVLAEVTLCTEAEGCQAALVGAGGDTGFTGGDGVFAVGHEGYVVCKAPAYELAVSADGCEPVERSEGDVAVSRAETLIEVNLDCGS